MRRLALFMAVAIALSTPNVETLGVVNNPYTVSAATQVQNEIVNKLFNEAITTNNNVTSLGFYSLDGLKMDSIVIPSSVKTIGIHCMEKGTIKSVTMPGKFSYKENVEGEEDLGYTEELRYTILPKADVVKLNTTFSPSVMKFFHSAKSDKKYKTCQIDEFDTWGESKEGATTKIQSYHFTFN